jgi:putative flippase GtrA
MAPSSPMAVAARQFLYFSAAGAVSFIVDAATLYLVMRELGAGLYEGRVLSYIVAATFSWMLNRNYTFRSRRSSNRLVEWGRFLTANTIGGVVNYVTYALLVATFATAAAYPTIGVAAGSLAGLVVNFIASRRVVFRERGPET